MRFATNRVSVLAQVLCTLALGCAALLGPPASASAGTILQFSQQTNQDFVAADSNITLTTHGVLPSNPESIPIVVSQVGDVPLVPAVPAFETVVTPFTSSGPQSGNQKGGYSGKIIISSNAGGLGTNILTATFSGNGLFSASGNAGSIFVPDNVTFTTAQQNIINAFGGATTATGSLSLSFVNVQPFQSGAFTGFTAQNTGLFSTTTAVIPEPASIVMASLGLLGVLGYGSIRHRSSKA